MANKKIIKLNNFEIGSDKLTILAGPCVAESLEILDETAKGWMYLEKAAKEGHPLALANIAMAYENGFYVKQDIKKALQYIYLPLFLLTNSLYS